MAIGAAREALAGGRNDGPLDIPVGPGRPDPLTTRFRVCTAETPGSRGQATAAHRWKLAAIRSKTWTILSLLVNEDGRGEAARAEPNGTIVGRWSPPEPPSMTANDSYG